MVTLAFVLCCIAFTWSAALVIYWALALLGEIILGISIVVYLIFNKTER